jgi:hypothetical protein
VTTGVLSGESSFLPVASDIADMRLRILAELKVELDPDASRGSCPGRGRFGGPETNARELAVRDSTCPGETFSVAAVSLPWPDQLSVKGDNAALDSAGSITVSELWTSRVIVNSFYSGNFRYSITAIYDVSGVRVGSQWRLVKRRLLTYLE